MSSAKTRHRLSEFDEPEEPTEQGWNEEGEEAGDDGFLDPLDGWIREDVREESETDSEVPFPAGAAEGPLVSTRSPVRQVAAPRRVRVRQPPVLGARVGNIARAHRLITSLEVEETLRIRERRGERIDDDTREAAALFRDEALTIHERLVLIALATRAQEIGALEGHSWALSQKPVTVDSGVAIPRVRIPRPGDSLMAQILGYERGPGGTYSRGVRQALKTALRRLAREPRCVGYYVLGSDGCRYPEVRKTLLVEPVAQWEGSGLALDLHPSAVASQLKGHDPLTDIGARYERARETLELHKLRDEMGYADEYMRYLSGTLASRLRADGYHGPRWRKRVRTPALVARLRLGAFGRDRGRRELIARITTALQFARIVGAVKSFEFDSATDRWALTFDVGTPRTPRTELPR